MTKNQSFCNSPSDSGSGRFALRLPARKITSSTFRAGGPPVFCRGLLQFPDIPVVLPDGPVGGEVAGLADVDQHFFRPSGAVFVLG